MAGLLFSVVAWIGAAHASESTVRFGAMRQDAVLAAGDVAFLADAVAYSRRTASPNSSALNLAEIALIERASGELRWSLPLRSVNDFSMPQLGTTSSGRLVANALLAGARALLVIDARDGTVVSHHALGDFRVLGLRRIGERLFAYGYKDGENDTIRPVAMELDADGGLVRLIEPATTREVLYFSDVYEGVQGNVFLHAIEDGEEQGIFTYRSRLFEVSPEGAVSVELVPPLPDGAPEAQVEIHSALAHAGGYWIAGRFRATTSSAPLPYLASIGPQGQPHWVRSDRPETATSGSVVDVVASGDRLLTLGVIRAVGSACIATFSLPADGSAAATGACDPVPATVSLMARDFRLAADGSARVAGNDAPTDQLLAGFEWQRDTAGITATRTVSIAPATRYSRIVYEEAGDAVAFVASYRNSVADRMHMTFGLSEFGAGARFALEPGMPASEMPPPFPVEGTQGGTVLVRESGAATKIDLATLSADWRLASRVPFGPDGMPGFEPRLAIADAQGAVYAVGNDSEGQVAAAHSDTPWEARLHDIDFSRVALARNPLVQSGPSQAYFLLKQPGGCRVVAMDARGVQREESLYGDLPVALLRSPQGRLLALCGSSGSGSHVFDVTESPAVDLGLLLCPHPVVGMQEDGTLLAFSLDGANSRVCRRTPGGIWTEQPFTAPEGLWPARFENGEVVATSSGTREALPLVRVRADASVEIVDVPPDEAEASLEFLAFGPGGRVLVRSQLSSAPLWRLKLLRADGAAEWTRESTIGDRVLPLPFTLGSVTWDRQARPVLDISASLRFGGPEAASVRIDGNHVFRGSFEAD